ncbi:Hypothetical predicted protein [Cloeon dipterum]|uniref:Uncharacterized protein n=1 Tax=Cloeon dipterum TaxID=197152 RepID=A0A8S1DH94_9INSE|nr:Hypothetical predicted protein [Cloeon dipterum]
MLRNIHSSDGRVSSAARRGIGNGRERLGRPELPGCAQKTADGEQIFCPEGLDLHLPEIIIALCLPIKVYKEDALPQVACRPCLAADEKALQNTAQQADSSLRRILDSLTQVELSN